MEQAEAKPVREMTANRMVVNCILDRIELLSWPVGRCLGCEWSLGGVLVDRMRQTCGIFILLMNVQ